MSFLDRLFQKKPNQAKTQTALQPDCIVPKPSSEPLPGFLVKPSHPLIQQMFGQFTPVQDRRCGYQIELNPDYTSLIPQISKRSTQFEIDETHIYSKPDMPSWQAVTIMKTPMVKTSPLQSMALTPYRMYRMLDVPAMAIPFPEHRSVESFESIQMHLLGGWEAYTRQKGLDESLVFCHVFRLNGEVYKDYILCARQGDFAWKLDCIIQSQENSTEIHAVDFVPPGFLFGGFSTILQ